MQEHSAPFALDSATVHDHGRMLFFSAQSSFQNSCSVVDNYCRKTSTCHNVRNTKLKTNAGMGNDSTDDSMYIDGPLDHIWNYSLSLSINMQICFISNAN